MTNRWAGGAMVLALAAAGCSRAAGAGQHVPVPAESGAPANSSTAPAAAPTSGASAAPAAGAVTSGPVSSAEMEALYRARADSARMRFTSADVQFMTGMISHHAQALVMSQMAPTHGASASVQTLASRIINSQNDEIRTMQQWLRDRGQAVPEVHDMGGHLMVMGPEMGLMPGMLTPQQMDQLDHARGAQFDQLFLTDMIQHHRGAISMVHDLFATPGAGQDEVVFKFASDVQVDQTTEVARMERMLVTMRLSGSGG